MQQSPEIKNLADALGKFQKEVENVVKDATNPFFKSKYASLENVIETVRPHLAKHGLSFSQFPDGMGLTTILMHSSGEWLQATASMTPKDATPQGHGSAITYLRRYALSAVLGLATEEDDDGNAASAPVASKTAARTVAKPVGDKDPAKVKLAAKDRIMALLKSLELPCKTKKQCEDSVFDLTGMALSEENYEDIGEALAERLEANNA